MAVVFNVIWFTLAYASESKNNVRFGNFKLFVKGSTDAGSSDEVAKPDGPSDVDRGQALPPPNVGMWWSTWRTSGGPTPFKKGPD